MNIVNAFDGHKAKVGDRVYSLQYGWGTIKATGCCVYAACPIEVRFDADGKKSIYDIIPDLYYGPPEIIGPEKPKRMVKEEVRLWLNIYPKSCCKITYSSRSRADSAAAPDRIACVELTGSYEVEED